MIIYTNCLGIFVFDEKINLKEKILFSLKESIENSIQLENGEELKKAEQIAREKNLRKPNYEEFCKILEFFKKSEFFPKFREINIALAKIKISESVNEDKIIIHIINNIEELNKVCNTLAKRLRDWYSLYFPEFVEVMTDNEAFVRLVLEKEKSKLMEEFGIKDSMGNDKMNIGPVLDLADKINHLYKSRENLTKYLEDIMNKYCRNLMAITGALIGAKLLAEAGSLERLSQMTSSTVQVLGAEKALFRHIKNKKALPPKYGYLINHPFVMDARAGDRGKIARALADKISIAVKVDYFKGEFIGEKLKNNLEKRFREIRRTKQK